MKKARKPVREKIAKAKNVTQKPADPKAPTRIIVGGRPSKRGEGK